MKLLLIQFFALIAIAGAMKNLLSRFQGKNDYQLLAKNDDDASDSGIVMKTMQEGTSSTSSASDELGWLADVGIPGNNHDGLIHRCVASLVQELYKPNKPSIILLTSATCASMIPDGGHVRFPGRKRTLPVEDVKPVAGVPSLVLLKVPNVIRFDVSALPSLRDESAHHSCGKIAWRTFDPSMKPPRIVTHHGTATVKQCNKMPADSNDLCLAISADIGPLMGSLRGAPYYSVDQRQHYTVLNAVYNDATGYGHNHFVSVTKYRNQIISTAETMA